MSTIMSLGTGTITIGGDLTVGRMAGPSVLSHGPAAWDLRSSARRYPSVLCALLDLSAHPDRPDRAVPDPAGRVRPPRSPAALPVVAAA